MGTFHFMEVFMLIVLATLIGYYIRQAIKYFKKKSNEGNLSKENVNEGSPIEGKVEEVKPKRNIKVILGIIVIILIGLTLPFHYLPQHGKILIKANLTFKNTIVTNSDIKNIVDRYNNGNFMQQAQMRQDPFIQTLLESGVLFDMKNMSGGK